ncbi:MAG: hypothetical protein CMJ31_07985 [Phycisphaerae bacterium]|nr:hypothetical protein [Phycisphaerae bacterium]
MWKWVVALVLILVLAGGGIAFVLSGASVPAGANSGEGAKGSGGGGFQLAGMFGKSSGPEATAVQVQAAERGDLVRTVSAPGSIEPRTKVQISSQVSAKILALPFREGDFVEEGEVVVRLDPQNLVAQLESAKASLLIEEARLDGAKADLINARIEFERAAQLNETGDAPKSELDSAEARWLQAQSGLKAIEGSIMVAKANIERVQKDIENTVIASPMTGTVTALNTEVGETAIVGTTNTPGSVIMEIADRSSMLLKAQVDETNIAPVEVDQTATVFINAYEDREYTGVVEKIGLKRQVSTSGTGYFVIEIALDLPEGERLLSGLSASTDIAVEKFFDAVKVPSQAVLEIRVDAMPEDLRNHALVDRDKTFTRVVYRMIDGEAIATPVHVGSSDLRDTMIEEGLEVGEVVVVGPYRELQSISHKKKIRDRDADEAEADTGADGEPDDTDADSEKVAEDEDSEEAPASAAESDDDSKQTASNE